jgi:hypothetical protein
VAAAVLTGKKPKIIAITAIKTIKVKDLLLFSLCILDTS